MKFKKLNSLAKIPTKATSDAAGFDLYAATEYDITIEPNQTVKIGTGIAVAIPTNCFGGIFARSGLATKRGLGPANFVGVIDADYRGEVIVALHNYTNEVQHIEAGERIAQLIILPYVLETLEEVNELEDTERGESGFGDSGRF